MNPTEQYSFQTFFITLTASWVSFLLGAIALALLGLFHILPLGLLLGVIIMMAMRQWKPLSAQKGFKISTPYGVPTALLVLSFAVAFTTAPTVFSGRDQGVMAEAAIQLAQGHQTTFTTPASEALVEIYGPGKALNFPGFHYTADGALQSQFPLPYIVWLGIFVTFFGTAGLIVANALLLFFFFCALWMLGTTVFAKASTTNRSHVPTIALITLMATTFPLFWFARFTLSENLMVAVLWSVVALVIHRTGNPRVTSTGIHWYAVIATTTLLFFTRIEGIACAVMVGLILAWQKDVRGGLVGNRHAHSVRWWIGFLTLLLLAAGIVAKSVPFYKSVIKAFFSNDATQAVAGGEPFSLAEQFAHFEVLWIYGLMPYLVLLVVAVGVIAYRWWQAKEMAPRMVWIPLVVTLPAFFYLVEPHISSDHPWMLRRFAFAIVPAAVFYTVYLLTTLRRLPFLRATLFALLLATNVWIAAPYMTHYEDAGLLPQVLALGERFEQDALLLIDREATGNGWAMMDGPLRMFADRNAVYFFNPEDFDKLDLSGTEHVYLITPKYNVDFWQDSILGDRLVLQDDYTLTTTRLRSSEHKKRPLPVEEVVEGVVYMIDL